MFRGRRNVAQEPNVLLVGSVLLTICLALLAGASHAADATNPMTPQAVPAQVPAKEGIAQIANGKLFYWDTGGSGPAVILLSATRGAAITIPIRSPRRIPGSPPTTSINSSSSWASRNSTPSAQRRAAASPPTMRCRTRNGCIASDHQ
jgi:hypothetical protein